MNWAAIQRKIVAEGCDCIWHIMRLQDEYHNRRLQVMKDSYRLSMMRALKQALNVVEVPVDWRSPRMSYEAAWCARVIYFHFVTADTHAEDTLDVIRHLKTYPEAEQLTKKLYYATSTLKTIPGELGGFFSDEGEIEWPYIDNALATEPLEASPVAS